MQGQAHVQGQPRVVLVDHPTVAGLTVSLSGTIQSRTIGRKGPVTLCCRSETEFTASKHVVFDPARGFVGDPAIVDVQTKVTTERIETRRGGPLGRAIERLAWSRVESSKEEVTAIVREKSRQQIREAFDRLLEVRLARVNRAANLRHAVAVLCGIGGQPRYACNTSQSGLEIVMASGRGDLSAVDRGSELPAIFSARLPRAGLGPRLGAGRPRGAGPAVARRGPPQGEPDGAVLAGCQAARRAASTSTWPGGIRLCRQRPVAHPGTGQPSAERPAA